MSTKFYAIFKNFFVDVKKSAACPFFRFGVGFLTAPIVSLAMKKAFKLYGNELPGYENYVLYFRITIIFFKIRQFY